jgi:hypothetical protein
VRRRIAPLLAALPLLLGAGSTLPPPPRFPLADRAVLQEEWAQRLVETLRIDTALDHAAEPGAAAPDVVPSARLAQPAQADLLCPRLADRRDGPPGRPPQPVPVEIVSQGRPLRGHARVEVATLYVLVVEGDGPQRWTVGEHLAGPLDPTRLRVDVAPRLLPLAAGLQAIEADAPAPTRVERAYLMPYTPMCVRPRDGWDGGRSLDYGSKARTLIQALALEGHLPVEDDALAVEGEHFARASEAARVTDAAVGTPASSGQWVVAAGGSPAELRYRLEVPRDGVYSVIARTHGGDRQLWAIGGGPLLPVHPVARTDGADAFTWTAVSTETLPAGTLELRVFVADGNGIDAVRLLRRRSGDDDYLDVLRSFGLTEGPAGAVVSDQAARTNLDSALVREGGTGFVGRLASPPGWDLGGTAARLQSLYTRPLSPFLPADL